jgi:hypothetical protein
VSSKQERRARNEAIFREVNERVEEVSSRLSALGDESALTGFVCECSREACAELVEITHAQYEAIRSDALRFLVRIGHEDLTLDRVVERHPAFFIVEWRGERGRDRARPAFVGPASGHI